MVCSLSYSIKCIVHAWMYAYPYTFHINWMSLLHDDDDGDSGTFSNTWTHSFLFTKIRLYITNLACISVWLHEFLCYFSSLLSIFGHRFPREKRFVVYFQSNQMFSFLRRLRVCICVCVCVSVVIKSNKHIQNVKEILWKKRKKSEFIATYRKCYRDEAR